VKIESLKAGALSLVFLAVFLGIWHLATLPQGGHAGRGGRIFQADGQGREEVRRLSDAWPDARRIRHACFRPVYDRGSNDKGIGIQLGHSLGRVALGYLIACLIAVPLGS